MATSESFIIALLFIREDQKLGRRHTALKPAQNERKTPFVGPAASTLPFFSPTATRSYLFYDDAENMSNILPQDSPSNIYDTSAKPSNDAPYETKASEIDFGADEAASNEPPPNRIGPKYGKFIIDFLHSVSYLIPFLAFFINNTYC